MKKNGTLKKISEKKYFWHFHVFLKILSAGCVGVAAWHVFVLESAQKMNGWFFCPFFKQKLGRGHIDFRPNKRTIHTGNPFLTSNRVYHYWGLCPQTPARGWPPGPPFFLLIKGTDIDWHFWKKGSKFQFFFSTTIFKGPKRVAAKRVLTHEEAQGGACIAFAPVRRGPRYAT